ncbi:MAG TPA: XRE family transcriptional regulator [Treponema sp.]|nr:XRE family transcriptional regulator [Treponema sp.]
MGSTFKENLKNLLKYEDITVKELAYMTGISKRSIENYLNARSSMPPADYACRIAQSLNTTVEKLLGMACPAEVLPNDTIRFLSLLDAIPEDDKSALLKIMQSLATRGSRP